MKNNLPLSQALWSDCETDEERVNFLQSGRAYETGIIANSIQHEVAMAYHFRAEIMAERTATPAPALREAVKPTPEEIEEMVRAYMKRINASFQNIAFSDLDNFAWELMDWLEERHKAKAALTKGKE